jgi:anti-sigma B factor antagonist
MPESPIVAVEELADAVVLHVLVDNLDEERLRPLQGEVRTAADNHPGQPCILDLGRVTFLPSMSLATLIRLHTEFRGRQQRLILAAVQPAVREVFVLTRLDRMFELHDDVAAATRAIRPA